MQRIPLSLIIDKYLLMWVDIPENNVSIYNQIIYIFGAVIIYQTGASVAEKIKKKNPSQFEAVIKKRRQILENPLHYKPRCGGMKGLRRVHVDRSFVLIFEVFESENKVIFWDFDHHDNIYKKR